MNGCISHLLLWAAVIGLCQLSLETLKIWLLFKWCGRGFSSFGPGSIIISQELRRKKCTGRVVIITIAYVLEVGVKAIDGALRRRLAVGRDATSCIVSRV